MQPNLGLRLRDKLGPEGSQDLSHAFEEVKIDMLTIAAERFDARLVALSAELRSEIHQTQSGLRQEMARMDTGIRTTLTDGLSTIRTDLSESRVAVMRWSFFFWLGQLTATIALIGLLLRMAGR